MAGSVLSFEQIDRTLLELAGGKGANLGELSRVGGIRVPQGFCVTTDAYREVLARNGEFIALLDELSRLGAGDPKGLRAMSSRIREVVETTRFPAVSPRRSAAVSMSLASQAPMPCARARPPRTCRRRPSRDSRTPI